MEGSSSAPDDDRDLRDLQARSYGLHPAVQDDPDGLARLAELEAARRALSASSVTEGVGSIGESPTPSPRLTAPGELVEPGPTDGTDPVPAAPAKEGWLLSFWRRATATRARRVASAMALLLCSGAVVAAVVLVSAPPRADATLARTAAEPDEQVFRLVREELSYMEIDESTLRAHESYRGLALWFGVNAFGSPCLLAVERSKGVVSEAGCAPRPADLFIDVSSWGDDFDGHPGEGIIRFLLRGDAVDAYIYFLPED